VLSDQSSSGTPRHWAQNVAVQEEIRWTTGADSVEELASGLSTLLQDESLQKRIGCAGRRTVLKGLTLAHQAERLSRIYRECLG